MDSSQSLCIKNGVVGVVGVWLDNPLLMLKPPECTFRQIRHAIHSMHMGVVGIGVAPLLIA